MPSYSSTKTSSRAFSLLDKRRRRGYRRSLFYAPLVIYLLFMFAYPLYYSVSISFKKLNQMTLVRGNAPFVGLKNYKEAWSGGLFWHIVGNTVEFTVASMVFAFVIGLLLALLFNKIFPGRHTLRSFVLVPWLIPQLISATIFKWLFDSTSGIINQALLSFHVIHHPIQWLLHPQLALIVIIITNTWIGIPFVMALIYSGLQDIPREQYEAAGIDGASSWKTFLYVTLPGIRSVLAIALMLGLIYTLKVFDIVMGLTGGGPSDLTQLLSTWSYTLSFVNFNFGQGAAIANGMMIIALVFTGIYIWSNKKTLE